MRRPWIAFFSQTGAEIADIAAILGHWPDLLITNHRPEHLRKFDERIKNRNTLTLPNKPTLVDYMELNNTLVAIFSDQPIITLHGWLRIIPVGFASMYEIYNGHPGLITKYPDLKGKDPQEKAYNLKLSDSGCVIHRVEEEVDEGEILFKSEVSIEGLDLEEVYTILRLSSLSLWTEYLPTLLEV